MIRFFSGFQHADPLLCPQEFVSLARLSVGLALDTLLGQGGQGGLVVRRLSRTEA